MNPQKFITDNLWGIIAFGVAMTIFYATTNVRLNNIEAHAQEARQEAASLRTLIERVIVLEEHDRNFADDIAEIKQDIKEIKQAVK
jgi:hypothetical protein